MEISRRGFVGGVAGVCALGPWAHAAASATGACDPKRSVECRARGGIPNARAKLRAGETVRIA